MSMSKKYYIGIIILVLLVVVVLDYNGVISIFGLSEDERRAELSSFEAVVLDKEDEASFKVVNYNPEEAFYISGFEMGISGEAEEYSRNYLRKISFGKDNTVLFNTVMSSMTGEYILNFPIKVAKDSEEEILVIFEEGVVEELGEDKTIFIKKIMYRKDYSLTSKVYEEDVDIVFPVK